MSGDAECFPMNVFRFKILWDWGLTELDLGTGAATGVCKDWRCFDVSYSFLGKMDGRLQWEVRDLLLISEAA